MTEPTTPTTTTKPRRELARRTSNGIEVRLVWSATDDEVSVEVRDEALDNVFELPVPRDRALDAFHHPYAYAARSGVDYDASRLHAA